jgi:flagellar biosynthetic protein FliR
MNPGKELIEMLSGYIPNFLFILLRAGIFVALMPFFSSKSFPVQFKIGLAVAIAFVLTPVVELHVTGASIPLVVFREVVFAMALGFSVRFVFYAIDLAGQAISYSMGFAMVTSFDPEFGDQSAEVARLQSAIATLLFFAVNGHHDLIYIFVKGYEILPAGQADIRGLTAEVVGLGGRLFVMAVKIAAPVVTGMLVASILLGFIYKAAPQINIFFVSFPIYIFLGFLLMLLSIPVLAHVLGGYFGEIRTEMERVFAIARG